MYVHLSVGEWSLRLPWQPVDHLRQRRVPSTPNPAVLQEDEISQRFAAAQLKMYGDHSQGWFFWSYRVDAPDEPWWSWLTCLEKGWIRPTAGASP
jgi:hypothetical protein